MGELKLQIKAKFKLKDYLFGIRSTGNVGNITFWIKDNDTDEFLDIYAQTTTTTYYIINKDQDATLTISYSDTDVFLNIEEDVSTENIRGLYVNWLPTKIYVKNAFGGPTINASVTLYESSGSVESLFPTQTTGADGFTTFPILPDSDPYYIEIQADSHLDYSNTFNILPRIPHWEFELSPDI